MGDPILQQHPKTGAYRVSLDDRASWQPAIVQENPTTGARRYSVDNRKTWNAYAGGSSSPANDNDADDTGAGASDNDADDGEVSITALDAVPDDPKQWSASDARTMRRLKADGKLEGDNWASESIAAYDKRNPAAVPAPVAGPNAAAQPANVNGEVSWGALASQAGKKLADFITPSFADGREAPVDAMDTAELPSDARADRRGMGGKVRIANGMDTLRGLGQGVTLRTGDELEGGLEGVSSMLQAGDTPGEQRAAGRGASAPLMTAGERLRAVTDESIDAARRDNATSQERSPYLYGAGEVAGAGAVAGLTAPVAAAGTPWTAMLAPNAVQGGAMGYIAGYGGSQGDERTGDALIGGATGAAGGALGTAMGAGAGRVARVVGEDIDDAVNAVKGSAPVSATRDWFGNLADRSRVAGTGAYGGQLKQITKNEGFDFTDRDLGQAVERIFPPKSGPLGIPIPRTARGYAKIAGPKADELGQLIDDSLSQMDAQGVSAPVRPTGYGDEVALVEPIDRELGKYGGRMRIGDDDKVMRAALRSKRMQALEAAGEAERLTPTQLAEMKRSLESSGYASEATKGLPVGVRREAQRIASAGPREALRDAAEKQALPETLEAWKGANRDYPIAKMIAELSEGRAAQEQGNQIVSLPSAAGTVASGGLGAIPAAVWEVAKRYGGDVTANTMRGAQRALTPAVREAVDAAPAMATAAQRTAVPAEAWAALANRGGSGMPAHAQQPSGRGVNVEIGEAQIIKRAPDAEAAVSEGHQLPLLVRNALKSSPQALGPYAKQLAQAAASEDPSALSNAISDLQHDEKFRTQVLPALQSTTGGSR